MQTSDNGLAALVGATYLLFEVEVEIAENGEVELDLEPGIAYSIASINYSVERITPDYWDFVARPRV